MFFLDSCEKIVKSRDAQGGITNNQIFLCDILLRKGKRKFCVTYKNMFRRINW